MRSILLLFVTVGVSLATAGANYNIPLWEKGQVPLAVGDGPLDAPFVTVFQPPASKRNGSAMIIAPGGSNIMLMYSVEGIELAERMNEWGTTVFVLTYRLNPRYNAAARTLDGNRAVRLVKHRAKEFGIDPDRVAIAGFSAGSELARFVTAAADTGVADAVDPIERESSKVHSLALVYSTGRTSPNENLKNFPPTFFLSAAADGPANPSAQMFVEMNKAGAVAEIHLYQRGRHGFGAATTSPEYGPWMDQYKHFLELNQFFGPKPAPAAKPVSSAKPPIKTVNDGYGELVFVSAGAFLMGDNNGDGEARERPVHTVEIDAFYIGKHEVTNAEWKKFLNDPGYDDVKFWPNGRVMPKDQIPYWTQPQNHGGGTSGNDAFPVIGVNWDGSGVGKSGPWHRSAPFSLGQLHRSELRQYGRLAEVRYGSRSWILRWQRPRWLSDPQWSVALRGHGYGGECHGMVLGLVRQRLLFGFPETESEGSRKRCLSRASGRSLLL
jgi:acetyl esterase/lipase